MAGLAIIFFTILFLWSKYNFLDVICILFWNAQADSYKNESINAIQIVGHTFQLYIGQKRHGMLQKKAAWERIQHGFVSASQKQFTFYR